MTNEHIVWAYADRQDGAGQVVIVGLTDKGIEHMKGAPGESLVINPPGRGFSNVTQVIVFTAASKDELKGILRESGMVVSTDGARVDVLERERWTGPPRLGPKQPTDEETAAATERIAKAVEKALDSKGQVMCTTSGEPVGKVRAEQTEQAGQHRAYIVLCEEERRKGFVRPYRDAYKHVGPKICGLHVGPDGAKVCYMDPGHQGDCGVATGSRPQVCQTVTTMGSEQIGAHWPLPNVWLGVSAEDQQRADERIPLLLQTPAAVRFVSAEPLLGPIRFKQQNPDGFWPPNAPQPDVAWLRHKDWPDDFQYWTTGLDWVIVGGESGPGARPMDLAWARSIVEQCKAAGVACFVKQLGAWIAGPDDGFVVQRWLMSDRVFVPPLIGPMAFARPDGAHAFGITDRKGGDPSEWPEDLRVREWPGVRVGA